MFRVRKPMSNDTVWGTIALFLVFLFYQHSVDAVVKNIEVILTDVCILLWNLLVCAVTDITSILILHRYILQTIISWNYVFASSKARARHKHISPLE